MLSLEHLARMVIRIRELQDRAHGSQPQGATYPEQLELGALRSKLARMKDECKTKQEG